MPQGVVELLGNERGAPRVLLVENRIYRYSESGGRALLYLHVDAMTILTKIKRMGMCTHMMLGIMHREGARAPG